MSIRHLVKVAIRMIARWRSSIMVAVRRTSFWLTVALVGNALVWLLVCGSTLRFPLDQQTLFGIRLGRRLSLALVMVDFFGVPLFGLFLFAVLVVALVHRLRRRPVVGLCQTCGYDLRATPERCPDCGALPPAVAPPPPDRTLQWISAARRSRVVRRLGRRRDGR